MSRIRWSLGLAIGLMGVSAAARGGENYQIDAAHSAVGFKVSHLGLSWCQGRFNEVTGKFSVDTADPAQTAFELAIKAETIDTNNQQRDGHLRSPDFFNVKQFPSITFKSTAVKPNEQGFDVTGDLTLHGVTRSVTFPLTGGRSAEFPPGVQRTGYSTQLKLKRSEFGMDKMQGPIGDEVYVSISFEGVKAPK